jgi:hypothetical protein
MSGEACIRNVTPTQLFTKGKNGTLAFDEFAALSADSPYRNQRRLQQFGNKNREQIPDSLFHHFRHFHQYPRFEGEVMIMRIDSLS